MAMAALPFAAAGTQAVGSILSGFGQARNFSEQQNVANANAAYDVAAGKTAFMAAASRGATQIREGEQAVGEQAAAVGQAGTGIQNAAPSIRQSETNQRMDYLNTIYGGELAKSEYGAEAQQQQYAAKIAGMNRQNAIFGGFLNAGTSLLTSGNDYRSQTGLFAPTSPTL
jgi:hypothetical protein